MQVAPAETRTTCAYCGVGCGVVAGRDAAGAVTVRADPTHAANLGRLCSKGAALAETLALDDRLLFPEAHGERCDWETALGAVAQGFSRIIAEHGPDAVAFYVSGQMLTEDYYVANKLMKGFVGSANIDTNSRLCMSSSVVGHKRAFGEDIVPGCYEDLEQAELVVLAGSNMAWCHPVLFQRINKAREAGTLKVVVIDPRRTATAEGADLFLPIAPGSDTLLWNGLLNYLRQHGLADYHFLEAHCSGYAAALEAAKASAPSIPAVASACGLSPDGVAEFYRLFAASERVVSAYSQGVNQSSCGTDKVNAIINCHLLTGRIGRPGMGPFSLTGQPNAMGGREVGGLATMLAAHMELDNAAHRRLVRDYWGSPRIAQQPGLKAVDLFEAVAVGKVKALWIMATNPVVSMPDADRVRAALDRCELVVVSDCIRHTDTTRYADILLPALAWGEKDGTVTNSERRISRQRAFLSPPGEARADWWIVCEVAKRMGHGAAFNYDHPGEIFAEHARLSGVDNNGERAFDISGLAPVSREAYEQMAPQQWPVPVGQARGQARLCGEGRFFTRDRKACLIPIVPRPPVHRPDRDYPLVLNSGRVRDHWHTMTRTGKSARLSQHEAEPFLEVHPRDVHDQGLQAGALAIVESRWGSMHARVRPSDTVRPGEVFVPMHWNERFAVAGGIGAVVNPVTDPLSGEPEFKHTPVRIAPFPARWFGFLLSTRRLDAIGDHADYATLVRGEGCYRYELAGLTPVADWSGEARRLLCAEGGRVEWIDFVDHAGGVYRGARLREGALESCIFISRTPRLPAREWLMALFQQSSLSEQERTALLTGRPPGPVVERGRTVCACFNVGEAAIRAAIATQGLDSVEAIGRQLRAGTNCGSCLPEIKRFLAEA